MKKYYRRFILWLFKGHIRSYAQAKIVSGTELLMVRNPVEYRRYVLDEIAIRIGRKLLEEGAIEFETRKIDADGSEEWRARMYFWTWKKHPKI